MQTSYYYALAFWFFAALAVIPALIMLLSKNIVRMALWLLGTFGAFAGLYILLGADFLAVSQIMIYIGGILILILFGIMLTRRSGMANNLTLPNIYGAAGILAFLVLLVAIMQMVFYTPWQGAGQYVETGKGALKQVFPSSQSIGNLLMSDFLLPFEIASLLLLAALAGAAYIIRRRREQ
jgi:NADH-quinone oxidoreductase subunit J